jgi:hypothetical protein
MNRDAAEALESLEQVSKHLRWASLAILRASHYMQKVLEASKGKGKGNEADGGKGKGKDNGEEQVKGGFGKGKDKGKGYGKAASSSSSRFEPFATPSPGTPNPRRMVVVTGQTNTPTTPAARSNP